LVLRLRDRHLWARVGWAADLRDSWRSLRRTPLQTVIIAACLTIGSTLTLLMYSVINTAVISWRDPLPPVVVMSILTAVGSIATWLPALRVSRIQPVVALRQD
jgi:putative ABC transport system permease protein